MENLTGQTIRGYEIRDQIGTGGTGIVYRAYQPDPGRDVAVKVILPEKAIHAEYIQRFELEAWMISQLHHPHIVPLYDYWRSGDMAFLVMKWLPGGSLRRVINAGRIPIARLLTLFEQIGGALHTAHQAAIIHRDVKPDNILFDADNHLYLTDFGVAKRLDSLVVITKPGTIVGSPAYLAPEQILHNPVTSRTDLYSLGITLFEALAGEHPFGNRGATLKYLMKQLQEQLPSILDKRPDLPPALNDVIRKATAKIPEERYPDVPAMLAALKDALAGYTETE